MMRFYRLKRAEPPWGDYGDMLIHGMSSRSKTGDLELERTGPFIPPISQPGNYVVVTEDFARELRNSGLRGFELGRVKKKRITNVEWREWEPLGTKEMKYPAGGEPENYILRRKHSSETADALGELWELRFQPGIQISREGGYHLVGSSWDGSDFVIANNDSPIYNHVSEKAKDWLVQNAPEWVAFDGEQVR
jgi:hypothetical protein